VAFLGPSGYGKSTLAASFAREGFPLASDDCLLVRGDTTGYLGVPAYPGVRLWPPSMEALFSGDTSMSGVAQFTQKRRVSDRESLPFSPSPACLRGLYVLDPSPDEDTRIEALTGAAAVGKLLESCFILTDRIAGAMRAIFSTLGGMVSAGLTFRLVYPSSFGRMPEVRKQILQHAVPLRSQPGRASVLCV
jgi:hypothetical protein